MKRAIFVRSKTIVMTELDKKIREKEIYRVTLVGSFVNFLLVIFKFLAGIAGHSAAMLADAVHSLSDFITDVVVILFVRISNKPVDKSHDYGHGKYESSSQCFIFPMTINQWTRAMIMVMGNMKHWLLLSLVWHYWG